MYIAGQKGVDPISVTDQHLLCYLNAVAGKRLCFASQFRKGGFTMQEEKRSFKEMGAQSAPYEELSNIKQQFAELERRFQRLYIYTLDLLYRNQSKDQKIDDLYCRIYALAEIPRKRKDQKKIRHVLQMIESRPQNIQDVALPSMELRNIFHTGMSPAKNVRKPRMRFKNDMDPFAYDRRRYNAPLPLISPSYQEWDDDNDGYE